MTDTQTNKVTINGTEYDVRDLSDLAKEQLTILGMADNNIREKQAELAVLIKGRETLVSELIAGVEAESTAGV